jgi:hypothetical protein
MTMNIPEAISAETKRLICEELSKICWKELTWSDILGMLEDNDLFA